MKRKIVDPTTYARFGKATDGRSHESHGETA